MTGYIELHCHSNFSFLDGASHPEELVLRAKELGMPALAITDHDGLYGAVRFLKAAREHGVRPIIGAEVTLENGTHLVLLARDSYGYSNLCRLISYSHLNQEKGKASLSPSMLCGYSHGLICLSGCRNGEIAVHVLRSEVDEALRKACMYADIFGKDSFFIEIQNHLLENDVALCERMVEIARRAGVKVVVTNNVHYHLPQRHRLQDVLVCIKNRTILDKSAKFRRANFEYYLKSAEEMASLFRAYPEALENTILIAEMCSTDLDFSKYRFPDLELPDGRTAMGYLRELCYLGAEKRYRPLTPEVINQLEHELGVIERMGLAGYFLIVWDIVRYAQEKGIAVRGRGSAADSMVAYVLGITAVDPLRYNLLFERFLNEEMKGTPDIDIDISTSRREELIQYVYQKYGHEHSAMVANVVTFQARNAVREVGKVLSIPQHLIDRLAKSLDCYSASEIPQKVTELGEFKCNSSLPWQYFISLCREIADFPRHLSIHVGGMVISSCRLIDIIPLEPATAPGRVVTQWNKDDIEEVGLVKVDLLGLRVLSLIHDALKLIERHRGINLDLDCIPLDDPKVFEMLRKADTVGVFQVESRAQMQTLPRMKPNSLDDLVVEVAVVRPGPIQGKMIHPYLKRRQGMERVEYLHPKLKPILEETLGVVLFQEQAIRIAVEIAGFTPGEADRLRRAMGKQRSREEMEKVRERFISGAVAGGVDKMVANQIFDQISSFASFGFCKSHAASFARTCYESAYLKVHYPVEFYCALLNNQPMGFYSPEVIVNDARRHGIKVLPVDINRSYPECAIEDGSIRLGFRYVKEVGESTSAKIVQERENGHYSSLENFYRRTNLSKEVMENLILASAFDSFGVSKRQLLWELGLLIKEKPWLLPLNLPRENVSLPEMTPLELIVAEYKVQGFSSNRHPMESLRAHISRDGVLRSSDIARLFRGTKMRVAGFVVARQMPPTAKGMCFLTLEDEDGLINVVVRPQVYRKYRQPIRLEPLLVVEGKLEKKDGIINIVADSITPLRLERMRQQALYPEPSSA